MSEILEVRTTAHDIEEKFITFEEICRICENIEGDFNPIDIENELCGMDAGQLELIESQPGGIKGFLSDSLKTRESVRRTTEYD